MQAKKIPETDGEMIKYADWIRILKDERLPVALVDLDAFERNVEKLIAQVLPSGKNLRIATKSIRVPSLIQRVANRGKPFQGVMCYSAQEALVLSDLGIDDLLVAYPTLQREDLRALHEVHSKGMKVTLVVDSIEGLTAIASASRRDNPFPVLIDIDASLRLFGGALHLGVRRSPVRNERDLELLIEKAASLPSISLKGMMIYEAQVAGLPDENPFKKFLNPIVKIVRSLSVSSVAARRKNFSQTFINMGTPIEVFNGGGTGSLTYACREPWLTEVTAGSALFAPHLFDYYSNIRFEPSAFFALQAVRQSDSDHITCQGGGYIASGEPGWDRVPVPWLPEGLKLVQSEGCGEVQTPLKIPDGLGLQLGHPVLFRHSKAGELCERFNEVLLISDGRIVERAKTYRGLGHSFY